MTAIYLNFRNKTLPSLTQRFEVILAFLPGPLTGIHQRNCQWNQRRLVISAASKNV